jgi:hypothetical protein
VEKAGNTATFLKRHGKAVAASIGIVFVVIWLLRAGTLPLFPAPGELERLDSQQYAYFFVGMLLHMLLRYARGHYLIAPVAQVPLRRQFVINAVSMAVITLLPLRLGEMSRPALLREKGRLSFGAVTGTVAAERIIDGMAFSLLLLAGLAIARPASELPDHIGKLAVPASLVPRAAALASIGFTCGFVLMLLFYFQRELARRLVAASVGLVSKPLAQKLSGIVERLSDGLRFITQWRYALPYLGVTLAAVLAHVWAISALAVGVGIPELGFAESSVLVGVLALGFAVPNAPGFFGQIQLAIFAGLAVYTAPEKVIGPGATLAFLFYVTYVGLVFGLAALAMLVGYGPAPSGELVPASDLS